MITYENASNAYKALALVAEAGEQGISTRAVAAALYPDCRAQRGQSWVGNNLRYHEELGNVERAGQENGGYHNIPSVRWRATDLAPSWLKEYDPARREHERRARLEEAATRRQRRAELAQLTEEAYAAYAREREAPRGDPEAVARRRETVVTLRRAGLSLAQIGRVFGISREMVRLDLRVCARRMREEEAAEAEAPEAAEAEAPEAA